MIAAPATPPCRILHRTAPRMRLPFRLVVLLVLGACGQDAVRDGEDDELPTIGVVGLADSVPYRNDLVEGVLRRVVVGTSDGTDTVPDVLTAQQPERLDDTSIVGFRYDEDRVMDVFVYTPGRGALRTLALPEDFFPYSAPRFAPGARHLAYLGRDSTGRGYGVVTAWPDGRVLHRGAPVTLLAGDAFIDAVRWSDAARFTIGIALAAPPGARQVTIGAIDAAGQAVKAEIDTIVPERAPAS